MQHDHLVGLFTNAFLNTLSVDNAQLNYVAAFELAMLRLQGGPSVLYRMNEKNALEALTKAYHEAYKLACRHNQGHEFDEIFPPDTESGDAEPLASAIIRKRTFGYLAPGACEDYDALRGQNFFLQLPKQQLTPLTEWPAPDLLDSDILKKEGPGWWPAYTYDRGMHAVCLGYGRVPFLYKRLPRDKKSYGMNDEVEGYRTPYTSAVIYNDYPLHSIAWLYRNELWWNDRTSTHIEIDGVEYTRQVKSIDVRDACLPNSRVPDEDGELQIYVYIDDVGEVRAGPYEAADHHEKSDRELRAEILETLGTLTDAKVTPTYSFVDIYKPVTYSRHGNDILWCAV